MHRALAAHGIDSRWPGRVRAGCRRCSRLSTGRPMPDVSRRRTCAYSPLPATASPELASLSTLAGSDPAVTFFSRTPGATQLQSSPPDFHAGNQLENRSLQNSVCNPTSRLNGSFTVIRRIAAFLVGGGEEPRDQLRVGELVTEKLLHQRESAAHHGRGDGGDLESGSGEKSVWWRLRGTEKAPVTPTPGVSMHHRPAMPHRLKKRAIEPLWSVSLHPSGSDSRTTTPPATLPPQRVE